MVQQEIINDGQWIRHYSDMGYDLLQNETGIIYNEAIDVIPCPFTYTEYIDETMQEEIPSEEFIMMLEEIL